MCKRMIVVGLDCLEPWLAFDGQAGLMPGLRELCRRGVHGRMRSTVPPITIPAWQCMMTGKDPGTLGLYGFRNRKDHTYNGLAVADGRMVRSRRLWDHLSRAGKRSVLLGVPQTYPPRPLNGLMISGFPLPDVRGVYTYPAGFKKEVASVVDYIADVGDFRTGDKRRVLDEVTEMTRRRFELARYLLEHKPWDFFMMVEMGTDRVVHLLWRHIDPDHRRYDPDHPLAAAVKDYYRLCDELVARLLEPYRDDPETVTAVVSDHGARAMEGGVRINEWLLRNGYLALHRRPSEPLSMSRAVADGLVDWSQTRAWAEGGYYSRLMVNVKGREPQGIVAPEEVSPLLEQIAAGVAAIPDDLGRKMATRACRPEEIYREVKNIPPDLMIFFGDLGWRAIGGILPDENAPLHVFENDAGPDDANHNWDGVFIMAGGGIAPRRDPLRLDILDFAPTVLSRLGLEVPADMAGKALVL